MEKLNFPIQYELYFSAELMINRRICLAQFDAERPLQESEEKLPLDWYLRGRCGETLYGEEQILISEREPLFFRRLAR
jgi:hypothetical protein